MPALRGKHGLRPPPPAETVPCGRPIPPNEIAAAAAAALVAAPCAEAAWQWAVWRAVEAPTTTGPPVPYFGDVLLLQTGVGAARLFFTCFTGPHVAPGAGDGAEDCPVKHIHRWWVPPPDAPGMVRLHAGAGTLVFAFGAFGALIMRDGQAPCARWARMALQYNPRMLPDKVAEMHLMTRRPKAANESPVCGCPQKVCIPG